MKKISILAILLIVQSSWSQQASTSDKVQQALNTKTELENNSLVKNISFQSVGPSIMSGRVVDLDVNPNDPTEFYVGYASGGLWYSNNNGQSFTPIMDNSPTQNVGDIAIDWKNGTIWVGTGEVNSSRSSYAGIGLLKSTDKGKTWQNMGLNDSHHIGRIILNPNNPNEVVVGVLGHLYSKNKERGIFKTIDGGKTWKQTLFVDDETGIIDLSVSPLDFNIQFASAWAKDRKAWNFTGNGSASGIYKSTDAGSTWKLVSTQESGFPTGVGVGRIGLALFNNNIIYAIHDNQAKRPKSAVKPSSSEATMFSTPGEVFLNIPDKEINAYLKNHGFAEKYRAQNLKSWVANNNMKPIDAKNLIQDANAALFETEVIGAEVYKSTDGGTTWVKTNQEYIDDFFYTYGYYFAHISVDPSNVDKLYISGVPLLNSKDGGKTFESISKDNVHSDHHIVWVNPKKAGHLISGNDGGLNITYDDGANWVKCNSHGVGQFYHVNVDYQKPYNIYGGLQDNGVWVGSNNYKYSVDWHQEGKYPYQNIMGGDGMQTQIDSRNPDIVFTGFQFGNYFKINRKDNSTKSISPKAKKEEKALRYNWQTPILLSSHNQDILYIGSQFLHRSFNQGQDWTKISPDLTQGGKEGNVAYGTITAFSESPFQFGLLYTGSDDGLVHVTKDGGASWQKVSDSFPKDLWVSRVVASLHVKERVYVALNGYRWDDFTSYIYSSEDNGQTWKSISSNMPNFPVNVVLEDSVNPNILYAGTDNGFYISFNKGTSWQIFMNGMPNVAVHDAVIQKEAKEIVIGTHGRSIYKASLKSIQSLTDEVLNKNLFVFDVNAVNHSESWGSSWNKWLSSREPEIVVEYYSKANGEYMVDVVNEFEQTVYQAKLNATAGLNQFKYNLAVNKASVDKWKKKNKELKITEAKNGIMYLIPGKYKIKLSQNKEFQLIDFEVKKNENK